MQINNPFQMNDWEIRKFLTVILAVQLALWGMISLDAIGIQVPILRQLIGFIYLTFAPGIIILRILKLHKLGNIETVLYTVGLSIATLMFTGFFMNMIYPAFGISGPISFTPLIITISVVVLALCVLSYLRDKNFSDPSYIDVGEMLSPPALFLCLIPFLAVLGTYLVNFHRINILLMLMIIVITIVVLLIGFDKFIPKNLYPLAVFVIAISLLYHYSLISMYITGADIHVEYYFANLVKLTGLWDSAIIGTCNAMLSIVMFAPIFSEICNLNLTWVFKIIYPFVFAFLPLGLYHIYQKQTDEKIAFLSTFYFMSVYTFYVEMMSLARQQIAEIFFMLIILVMISKRDMLRSHILLIIFGIGLIISHYGLSYLFLFFGLVGYIFMIYALKYKSATYHYDFLILYIVFALSWYMYASSGSAFETIINIGSHIYNTMLTEALTTTATTLAVSKSAFITGQILRVLYLTSQFFILVGVVKILIKRVVQQKETGFYDEYLAFSVICFAVLAASVITSSTGMNIHRLYHIVSIVLAPFCVIGGIAVFKMLAKVVRVSWTNHSVKSSLKVLSVFFVIFLLFNSGFVQEVAKDNSGSISLSQESIKKYGDAGNKNCFYAMCYPEQDIFGVKWISENRDTETKIFADLSHKILPFRSYGMMPDENVFTNTTKVGESSYIYLGYPNVRYGLMNGPTLFSSYWNITDISPFLDEKSLIYINGGSKICK
jgi:uncharacterized membrane protein